MLDALPLVRSPILSGGSSAFVASLLDSDAELTRDWKLSLRLERSGGGLVTFCGFSTNVLGFQGGSSCIRGFSVLRDFGDTGGIVDAVFASLCL